MSCIASAVSSRSTEGSTVRNRRPPGPSTTPTPSEVRSRYSVASSPSGSKGAYTKSAVLLLMSAKRTRRDHSILLGTVSASWVAGVPGASRHERGRRRRLHDVLELEVRDQPAVTEHDALGAGGEHLGRAAHGQPLLAGLWVQHEDLAGI